MLTSRNEDNPLFCHNFDQYYAYVNTLCYQHLQLGALVPSIDVGIF